MTAEQRACPRCGQAFTWTPAAPRQKYCRNSCRSAYNRNPARYAAGPVPPGSTTTTRRTATPGGTTTAMRTPPAGGTAPGDAITTARPCPHCGQPVTAVTWIVPPAAATVTTPLTGGDTPARSVTGARQRSSLPFN